jgi:hypothetical protein
MPRNWLRLAIHINQETAMKSAFVAMPLALVAATCALTVRAQDALPMVDGVGSYTHSQVMRHRGDGGESGAIKQSPSRYRVPGPKEASPKMRSEMAALEPEYRHRVTRDGKASADRWLNARARTLWSQERTAGRSAARH